MSTLSQTGAGLWPAQLPTTTGMGTVSLSVTSIDAVLPVWRDIVGLPVLANDGRTARLGAGSDVLVELVEEASLPVQAHVAGLYHVALHVPERWALGAVIHRASAAGWRHSTPDHIVTQTCYLSDPEGNGIEIAFETPWRGRFDADFAYTSGTGFFVIDADGNPRSGAERLDLASVLDDLAKAGGPRPMPAGTRVGHVHLSVGELPPILAFYNRVIGFAGRDMTRVTPMVDFLGGYEPHILTANAWAAPLRPRPQGAGGLRFFTITIAGAAELAGIAGRLSENGHDFRRIEGGIETTDPAGNILKILIASATH